MCQTTHRNILQNTTFKCSTNLDLGRSVIVAANKEMEKTIGCSVLQSWYEKENAMCQTANTSTALLKDVATHYNTLQHTATHCNTLHFTATHGTWAHT